MAADYIVRLSGKDDLSDTIKNVKNSLADVGKETGKLDKIKERFDKIQGSSAPLKRQLRDLKALMSQMNMDGLSNTHAFEEMAMYAGEVKDAMADANDAISRFADDNMKLSAMAEGFSLIAGAASTATGIMGMFGVENDKVQAAILKVQSVMAALNGVQAIANALNKDSVLMHRIKQVRLAASTAAQSTNTVTVTANTVAVGANTAATVANTTATRAWNTTKAVAKALLGDWTGLILVGATALTAYAVCTSDAAEAEEQKASSTNKAADAQDSYNKIMVDTYSQLMTTYTKLKNQYSSLASEHQKTAWITENKNKLKDLGLEVNNVADAEKIFSNNTSVVVEAFAKRARAAARLAQLTELYKKQMELIDKKDSISRQIKEDAAAHGRHAKAGDEIKDETFRSSRYGSVGNDGKWRFSTRGAALYSGTDTSANTQIQALDNELKTVNNTIVKVSKLIGSENYSPSSVSGKNNTTHNTTTTPKTTTTTKEDTKKESLEGSIGAYEKKIQQIQNDIKNGYIPLGDVDKAKEEIDYLKELIDMRKRLLGIDEYDVFKNVRFDNIKEKEKKDREKLLQTDEKYQQIQYSPQQSSSFDKVMGINYYDTKTLDGIKNQMNFNDSLIKQLEDLKKAYENLGATGEESYTNILTQLAKVNGEQANLGEKAKNIKEQNEKFETQRNTLEGLADMSGQVGGAFSALGDVFQKCGNDAVAGTMQIMASTAQATADIIPQILKLIGAKQGEAIASGTASASALPFPANIGAIASIVATIMSTFAQIGSIVGAFADGGVVGGSLHGDKVLARLNGGEMVLNKTQQSKLFHAIESGRFGDNNNTTPSTITWKIKGSDLYGTLSNYKSIKIKQGKNIKL